VIENNTISNIYGVRYVYRTTSDASDATTNHCSPHIGASYYDCWTDESTGSGITSNNQTNMIIRNNTIDSVSRTSIYISGIANNSNSFLITGNTVRNHRATGLGLVVADTRSSAIIAASVKNVTISNNSIINSHAVGISAEDEAGTDYSTSPPHSTVWQADAIQITGNTFSNGAMPDVWVNGVGSVTISGNTDAGQTASCVSGDYANLACNGSNIHFSSSALSNSNLASSLIALQSALSALMGILGK
jgi:hypothetical protein